VGRLASLDLKENAISTLSGWMARGLRSISRRIRTALSAIQRILARRFERIKCRPQGLAHRDVKQGSTHSIGLAAPSFSLQESAEIQEKSWGIQDRRTDWRRSDKREQSQPPSA